MQITCSQTATLVMCPHNLLIGFVWIDYIYWKLFTNKTKNELNASFSSSFGASFVATIKTLAGQLLHCISHAKTKNLRLSHYLFSQLKLCIVEQNWADVTHPSNFNPCPPNNLTQNYYLRTRKSVWSHLKANYYWGTEPNSSTRDLFPPLLDKFSVGVGYK